MNRRLLSHAVFAALVSLVSFAAAQESATQEPMVKAPPTSSGPDAMPKGIPPSLEERYQQMAEQLKQGLPKREIKIQVDATQKIPLLRADPKLFESKFIGNLALLPAGVDFANESSAYEHVQRLHVDLDEMQKYPQELKQLLFLGGRSLFHSQRGPRSFSPRRSTQLAVGEGEQKVHERFQLLLKQSPAESGVEKSAADYLASAGASHDVFEHLEPFSTQHKEINVAHQHLVYQILAPSAEEVERRARGIVALYDAGLSRPLQQFLLGLGQKRLEQARQQYGELSKTSEELRALSATLAKPSEISGDILSQLKAQKVMVAVELAGLNARVKACDAMLTDPKKLEISALQSVSDMKVKAEIERVGIKEKLDQINVFIAEGDARVAASSRESVLREKAAGLLDLIRHNETGAARYAELFALYAPLQVFNNKITISPIEWTQQ